MKNKTKKKIDHKARIRLRREEKMKRKKDNQKELENITFGKVNF